MSKTVGRATAGRQEAHLGDHRPFDPSEAAMEQEPVGNRSARPLDPMSGGAFPPLRRPRGVETLAIWDTIWP